MVSPLIEQGLSTLCLPITLGIALWTGQGAVPQMIQHAVDGALYWVRYTG